MRGRGGGGLCRCEHLPLPVGCILLFSFSAAAYYCGILRQQRGVNWQQKRSARLHAAPFYA